MAGSRAGASSPRPRRSRASSDALEIVDDVRAFEVLRPAEWVGVEPRVLRVDVEGRDAEVRRSRFGVEALIPDGDDEVWIADSDGAGEVDRIGAAKSMKACEVAGMTLDSTGELDRSSRRPVLVPGGFCRPSSSSVRSRCRFAAASTARTSG